MLQLHHLSAEALACTALHAPQTLLGAACFGARGGAVMPTFEFPLASVHVEPLPGETAVCEVWSASGPMLQGRAGRMQWRGNAEVLFAVVQVHEAEFAASAAPLQAASQAAYDALFEGLDALGYAHLLRIWNHIPDSNGFDARVTLPPDALRAFPPEGASVPSGRPCGTEVTLPPDSLRSFPPRGVSVPSERPCGTDIERYRAFNIGRQDAFLRHGRTVQGASVPAASALGAAAGAPLLVYALVARRAAQAIENPRQLSAYHYPQDYGPRSPTFSRASLMQLGGQRLLSISGTASIVGHRTLHVGDVVEQTRETLRNIEAVLEQAQARGAVGMTLADLHYKVYVRHAANWPLIRAELQRAAGPDLRAIALQADVCRADLLVEVEAVGMQQVAEEAAA